MIAETFQPLMTYNAKKLPKNRGKNGFVMSYRALISELIKYDWECNLILTIVVNVCLRAHASKNNRPFSYSVNRLDQALFLYIFIRDGRSSGVRASISIMQIRNSTKFSQIPFDSDSSENS